VDIVNLRGFLLNFIGRNFLARFFLRELGIGNGRYYGHGIFIYSPGVLQSQFFACLVRIGYLFPVSTFIHDRLSVGYWAAKKQSNGDAKASWFKHLNILSTFLE